MKGRGFRAGKVRAGLAGLLTVWPSSVRGDPPQPFTEEAVARGVNYVVAHAGVGGGFGAGVAFADLDGGSDPDLVLIGRSNGVVGVYENNGSGYVTDRSASSNIAALAGSSGVTAADYDGDGAVSAADANHFQQCVTGPGHALVSSGCEIMDLDGNAAIDLRDYAMLQRAAVSD